MRKSVFSRVFVMLVVSVVSTGAQTMTGEMPHKSDAIRFTNVDYPGSVSNAGVYDINPRGDMVGIYNTSDGAGHSYVLSRGVFHSIDLADIFPASAVKQAWFEKITPSGDAVVGTVVTEGPCNGCPDFMFQGVYHAVIWSNGRSTALHVPNAAYTTGYGINSKGEVVGEYMIGGLAHAYRWRAGTFSTIDYPGAVWTSAMGNNDSGDIVGWYTNYPDLVHTFHGFVLHQGKFTAIDAPGASWTLPYDINDRGDVVGMYIAADGVYGFVWRDGKLTTVDVPGAAGTKLFGIDNQGDMGGWYTTNGQDSHGVLLHR